MRRPPPAISTEAPVPFRNVFAHLMTIWVTIAAAVFVIVTGLLLFAIVRNRARRRAAPAVRRVVAPGGGDRLRGVPRRRRRGAGDRKLHDHLAAERGRRAGRQHRRSRPATRVDVTAFRWCWDFSYPGTRVARTGDCTAGDYPTVVVPAGQPVEFAITSRDVVHAFWLPDFDAKMDAYPDHENTAAHGLPDAGPLPRALLGVLRDPPRAAWTSGCRWSPPRSTSSSWRRAGRAHDGHHRACRRPPPPSGVVSRARSRAGSPAPTTSASPGSPWAPRW